MSLRKKEILEIFGKLTEKLGRYPTINELKSNGISRKSIRYHYTNKENLENVYKNGEYNLFENETEEKIQTETSTKTDLNEEKRSFIIKAYLNILKDNKRFPIYSDFIPYGITSGVISSSFGGIQKLQDFIITEYEEELKEVFTTLNDIIEKSNITEDTYIGKRYIITTAVADFKVHDGFIKSITTYSDVKDAEIIILPCESVTNSFEQRSATFDKCFNTLNCKFVLNDIKLNDNLFLCSIQVSAKQIKSTTGLSRLGKREGSYIFASPKQFLDYRPSGHDRGHNYSIMTTGSCTTGDYYANTSFVSKRLSYIANHDHLIGAIIVEIENSKHFHFRQIQADIDGSFIDLGVKYNPDGSTEEVGMSIVMGDLHGVNHDEEAVNSFVRDFKDFDVKKLFLHDVFDGISVSHHITNITEKHVRASKNYDSLEQELQDTVKIIDDLYYNFKPKDGVFVVKSNHDEFLDRYLKEGRYVHDPKNHHLSLKIALEMLEGNDVLKSAFKLVGAKNLSNIKFLNRYESFKIGNVEMAAHGDLGVNGAKPSLNGMEEVYGDCIIGHNHTGAIQRGVFRVGTMSKLDLGYNRGPSSWTHTNCIIYDNGQRQLVNCVNGKYYL